MKKLLLTATLSLGTIFFSGCTESVQSPENTDTIHTNSQNLSSPKDSSEDAPFFGGGKSDEFAASVFEIGMAQMPPEEKASTIDFSHFGDVFSLHLQWEDAPYIQKFWLSVGSSQESLSQKPWGDIYSASMGKKTSAIIPLPGYSKQVQLPIPPPRYSPEGNVISDSHDEFREEIPVEPPFREESTIYIRLWSKINDTWRHTDLQLDVPRGCSNEYAPVCGKKDIPCLTSDCPSEYQTYSNICHLDEEGAEFQYFGECNEEPRVCDDEYNPVCAQTYSCSEYDWYSEKEKKKDVSADPNSHCQLSEKTFRNSCEAEMEDAKIVHFGECEIPSSCPDVYNPVCAQVKVCSYDDYTVVSDENKNTSRESNRYCQMYEETFSNSCEAEMANAKILRPGACEEVPECPIVCANIAPVCTCEAGDAECANACRPEYATIDACVAQEERFPIEYTGECKYEEPECPSVYEPVCGEKEVSCVTWPCPPILKTYQNECLLKKEGAKMVHEGLCEQEQCDSVYEPVCGEKTICPPCVIDGLCNALCEVKPETYSNECELLKDGGRFLYSGWCEKNINQKKDEKKTQPKFCDANLPCTTGECYLFEESDYPICYEGDPCEKCDSQECVIATSYPMQVSCKK